MVIAYTPLTKVDISQVNVGSKPKTFYSVALSQNFTESASPKTGTTTIPTNFICNGLIVTYQTNSDTMDSTITINNNTLIILNSFGDATREIYIALTEFETRAGDILKAVSDLTGASTDRLKLNVILLGFLV